MTMPKPSTPFPPPPADPNHYDDLRRAYQPETVKLLFVGESRPVGRTFFYKGNSVLFRATQTAFAHAYGRDFGPPVEFLDFFRDQGCYLLNLCSRPVNQYEPNDPRRKELRQAGVEPLSVAMRSFSPTVMVCVMKDIAPYVRAAHRKSELRDCPLHVLRFPRYYLQSYISELTAILNEFRTANG